MKQFYTYLRSIVALVAMCLPMLVTAQDLDSAPDAIVGRYTVQFGEATIANGEDASDIKLTYTATIAFNRSLDLDIDGIIGTPSYSEYNELDERVTYTKPYYGVYNATSNTITVSFPVGDYEITDLNSGGIFSLTSDQAFVLNVTQNEDGLYVLSTDKDVTYTYNGEGDATTCTFKGVTLTQQKSYTIAQADLVGTWNMNYQTYNDDGDVVDATSTFQIVEEDGTLYFTAFEDLTGKFPITYNGTSFNIPAASISTEEAGEAVCADFSMMDTTTPVTFVFGANNTLNLDSYLVVATSSAAYYALPGATAVKEATEEPKEEPKALGESITSLDELDLTKTYALYNDHFTAYPIYSEVNSTTNIWAANMIGDSGHGLQVETVEFDATSAAHSWMVMKKDDNLYIYNLGAKKYLQTPSANGASLPCTFSDEPVALSYVELGNGKFAFKTSTASDYDYFCAAPQLASNPLSVWTSDDAGSAWEFKENPNVEFDLEVAKEFGYVEPTDPSEPAADPAPADLAGRYDITVGDYTWINENEFSSVDVTAYAHSFKGTIEIDANGKALMKGLIGTPAWTYYDMETWEQHSVDSAYVGSYNAAESTITFTYPADNLDNNNEEYTMFMDGSYDTWKLSEAFTVKVAKGEDGLYTLSTSDPIHFVLGGSDYVDANGATFTQLKSYPLATEDLLGWWSLSYSYSDDLTGETTEAERPLKVKIVQHDDQLFMIAGNGATVEFPIELTSYGFKLTAHNSYAEDGSYQDFVSSSWMSVADVEFVFTEEGTFELLSDLAVLANDKLAALALLKASAARPVVEVSPAPGHYETMPSTFVICTNAANVNATKGVLVYYGSNLESGSLMTNGVEVKSDSLVITLPESTVLGATTLRLNVIAYDADGNYIEYGATGSVLAEYTADEPETPQPALGEAITSLDELSGEKTYVIYNDHFTAYAIYHPTMSTTNIWAANMIGDSGHGLTVENVDLDITSADHSWMVMKKDDNLYIYNLGAKKYLQTPSANGASLPCTFSDEPVALSYVELGDGKFAFKTSTASDYDYFCAAPQLASNPLSVWTSDDAGSAWQFIVNPNVEADAEVANYIATDIRTAVNNASAAEGVYTLGGVKLNVTDVRKLTKGVYVVNGKKVVVK